MYDTELAEQKKKVDVILAPKTKEFWIGYNKAIDDFMKRIQALEHHKYYTENNVMDVLYFEDMQQHDHEVLRQFMAWYRPDLTELMQEYVIQNYKESKEKDNVRAKRKGISNN